MAIQREPRPADPEAQSAATNDDDATSDGELAGRRIVLGLSGGIACYKAAELTRALVKEGAVVQVVMSEAAEQLDASNLAGPAVSAVSSASRLRSRT